MCAHIYIICRHQSTPLRSPFLPSAFTQVLRIALRYQAWAASAFTSEPFRVWWWIRPDNLRSVFVSFFCMHACMHAFLSACMFVYWICDRMWCQILWNFLVGAGNQTQVLLEEQPVLLTAPSLQPPLSVEFKPKALSYFAMLSQFPILSFMFLSWKLSCFWMLVGVYLVCIKLELAYTPT